MGNCLKKQLQDPNQPVAIPHPSTTGLHFILFLSRIYLLFFFFLFLIPTLNFFLLFDFSKDSKGYNFLGSKKLVKHLMRIGSRLLIYTHSYTFVFCMLSIIANIYMNISRRPTKCLFSHSSKKVFV